MNKVYIIRLMTESDIYDGEYNIPITTIVEEAELINTIIPADNSSPFYEVVPFVATDEYGRIIEQKPVFSYRQGFKNTINSIYVDSIYRTESLALEESYNRNKEIIEKRKDGFKKRSESTQTIRFDLERLQQNVNSYHELEKGLNHAIDEQTIDYYTGLLNDRFQELKKSFVNNNKGRKLIYENKDNN